MALFDPQIFEGDTQSEEAELPPPGTYPFIVDEAVTRSKERGNAYRSGNDGVELHLQVGTDKGDWLVFAHLVNTPNAVWKIREFCKCTGMGNAESIESAREFVNKAGIVKCKHDKDQNGRMRLVVERFMPPEKKKDGDKDQRKLPF